MSGDKENRERTQILIVDDIEANRFVLRDIVEDMGYQPILTENGAQALRVLQRMRPHLILLDIAMPEMDGFEVCKRIKENVEIRDIPIVFISAFDEPQDIVNGFSLGGEDYITKPFIPEVVKIRIGTHLKLAEANKKMVEMNRRLQVSVSEQRKQIEVERKNVLYALIRVARENAAYDKDFMKRLSYNSRLLAEAMQLSEQYGDVISDGYIDMIELAAPLCDLGNMAIPTDILQKHAFLNMEENEVMQKHTSIGAGILKDIKELGNDNGFINMAMDIAQSHHENWDGSGYPEGKSGMDIPLAAQIVSVSGVYCSLTEKRTYRDAFSREEAFEIMEKEATRKFNPEIFWIMKKISRQLK